ncbi:MAG: hypothetical protein ACE5Q6_12470 [Dehalococcoidia bacterium]
MTSRYGTKQQTTPTCAHYWIIEVATGPTSEGVCQHCGQTRTFQNFVERQVWAHLPQKSLTDDNDPTSLLGVTDQDLEDWVG